MIFRIFCSNILFTLHVQPSLSPHLHISANWWFYCIHTFYIFVVRIALCTSNNHICIAICHSILQCEKICRRRYNWYTYNRKTRICTVRIILWKLNMQYIAYCFFIWLDVFYCLLTIKFLVLEKVHLDGFKLNFNSTKICILPLKLWMSSFRHGFGTWCKMFWQLNRIEWVCSEWFNYITHYMWEMENWHH